MLGIGAAALRRAAAALWRYRRGAGRDTHRQRHHSRRWWCRLHSCWPLAGSSPPSKPWSTSARTLPSSASPSSTPARLINSAPRRPPVRLAVRAYLIRRSSHRPAVRLAVEAQLGGRHTATQAALKRPYRRRTAGPSARWWSGRAQLGCSEQTVQDRMTTTTTTEESHLDGRRNTMADRPRHVHAH